MTYDEWRKWWTERAPEYFTDKSWHFSQPDLIDRLGILSHHCVLEVGPGYGRELSEFCKKSVNVYGLELTDWACNNILKELGQRKVSPLPRLRSYDGLVMPFPSGAFNVVYSCFVVQHVSREHALALMGEALRVLCHDGHVLFEFFGDPAYWDGGKDVFSGIPGEGGMYNNAYTPDEIRALVDAAGGSLEWLETRKVTKDWGNHWVCFGRQK